jgi:cytoskeletal protein CcmA (bactofilin family)
MGATYTRQSTYADGDTITAAHTNDEFDQLLAAFASSSGHTHDGTTAEGGPITKLLGNTLTFGAATSGTDITITFDGESNDGVLKWMEDEDYFEFSDDILVASTEKVQLRDTGIYIYSSTDGQLDAIADGEVAITSPIVDIDASTGIALDGANLNSTWTVNAANKIQWRDSGLYINSSTDGQLDIVADTEIQIAATTIDINGAVDVSGEIAAASLDISGNIDVDGITNLDVVDIDGAVDMATTLAVAGNVDFNGDLDVDGTTNLDAVDIDGAVQLDATLTIGANDQGYDVILYGDTASANITWDTSADDLIFNGAAGLIVPDGQFTLGSTAVTSTAAEINLLDTASANSVVNSKAVIYGSSGELAGTLSTAAQANVTSLGTLTALTVDDVAIDGKVITMTGSASDTAVITAAANGALSIVTTDAAAAAANIQITADGTAELAGTTVTLDSEGGITLDANGGTITFADDGASLGTITSSGYSGTSAVATTVVVSDNESTNENNAIIFSSGGDVDGGTFGLESDGNLTYNPSTGTLSATNISVTGTFTTVDSVTMDANNAVVFEGSTADAHETTLTSIDATGDRTISLPNVSGTLPVLAAASTTQISSTPEEINLIDGGTARGTTAVASGDGILINDAGTMRMTNVDTVSTYFSSHNVGGSNIVTTGALNSGSITSGFGTIDTGSSNITTTGVGSFGSLDISGAIDVDGTTNLDVVDIDGAVDMASTLTVNDSVTFVSSGSSKPVLTIKNTNADTTPPAITFQKDSSSPADNDEVANINFFGDDDGGNVAAYANLKVVSTDVSDGSEDGKMTIQTMTAGTLTNTLVLESGATTVSGTLAATGKITADAGIDIDNFNIDGTTIALSSGDMVLDSAGDIVLDAGGQDINLKDDGTHFAALQNENSDFRIISIISDKDIIFRGNDGGSYIDALTLDMSDAGKAAFNKGATFGASVTAQTDTDTSNSGSVTLDFAANQNFVLTMTGNVTLANPTTETVGQSGFIACIQDGTGSRTLSLGTDYETAGGAGITLTTTASATDLIPYVVIAANRILLGTPQLAFS